MPKKCIERVELPPSINLKETQKGLREYFGGLAWEKRGGGESNPYQYEDDSVEGDFLASQYILGMGVCKRKKIIIEETWNK